MRFIFYAFSILGNHRRKYKVLNPNYKVSIQSRYSNCVGDRDHFHQFHWGHSDLTWSLKTRGKDGFFIYSGRVPIAIGMNPHGHYLYKAISLCFISGYLFKFSIYFLLFIRLICLSIFRAVSYDKFSIIKNTSQSLALCVKPESNK